MAFYDITLWRQQVDSNGAWWSPGEQSDFDGSTSMTQQNQFCDVIVPRGACSFLDFSFSSLEAYTMRRFKLNFKEWRISKRQELKLDKCSLNPRIFDTS